MKKLTVSIIIIIVLLAVSYITSSWYIGNVIRNNIENEIKQITQQANANQDELKISIRYSNYQQHIFSTQLHLFISALNSDNKNITLFNDAITIHHGPFPSSALFHGQFIPQMVWIDYAISQETSPQLWRFAGNKPFITGSLSVDFEQNRTLKLANTAMIHLPEPINIEDYNVSINQLSVSPSELILENNKDFTKFVLNLNVDQLQSVIDSETISLSNLQLTIKENERNTGFSCKLQVGNLLYQVENINETSTIAMDILDLNGDIDKNQHYDINVAVNNLIYAPDVNVPPFSINKLALNQKNSSNNQNTLFHGELTSSLASLKYGQQNLGSGDVHLIYKELDNELLGKLAGDLLEVNTPLANDNGNNNRSVIFLSLDKLNWYNKIGQMSASANANLLNNYLDTDSMNINSIDTLKLNINIPFNVLSQMVAQIDNPQTTEVTAEQLNDMNQSMQMLAIILSRPLPIFAFSKADIEGIYSDLVYSKNNNYVQINGEMMDKKAFLSLFH